ncbi:unnamed protein product, partial [Allacma fusca]
CKSRSIITNQYLPRAFDRETFVVYRTSNGVWSDTFNVDTALKVGFDPDTRWVYTCRNATSNGNWITGKSFDPRNEMRALQTALLKVATLSPVKLRFFAEHSLGTPLKTKPFCCPEAWFHLRVYDARMGLRQTGQPNFQSKYICYSQPGSIYYMYPTNPRLNIISANLYYGGGKDGKKSIHCDPEETYQNLAVEVQVGKCGSVLDCDLKFSPMPTLVGFLIDSKEKDVEIFTGYK